MWLHEHAQSAGWAHVHQAVNGVMTDLIEHDTLILAKKDQTFTTCTRQFAWLARPGVVAEQSAPLWNAGA